MLFGEGALILFHHFLKLVMLFGDGAVGFVDNLIEFILVLGDVALMALFRLLELVLQRTDSFFRGLQLLDVDEVLLLGVLRVYLIQVALESLSGKSLLLLCLLLSCELLLQFLSIHLDGLFLVDEFLKLLGPLVLCNLIFDVFGFPQFLIGLAELGICRLLVAIHLLLHFRLVLAVFDGLGGRGLGSRC